MIGEKIKSPKKCTDFRCDHMQLFVTINKHTHMPLLIGCAFPSKLLIRYTRTNKKFLVWYFIGPKFKTSMTLKCKAKAIYFHYKKWHC